MAFVRRLQPRSKILSPDLLVTVALAFFASVSLSSCATVANRHQSIVIDSDPAGALVSLTPDRKGLVGQAPLVMRAPSAPQVRVHALYGDDPARPATAKCSFAWGELLLGNLPVAAALGPALGGIYYGVALGTDILTESAYECPARLNMRFSPQQLALNRQVGPKRGSECRTIAVVPPYHFLRSVSDEVEQEWRREVSSQLRPCDVVLPMSITRGHLAGEGLTFDSPSQLKSMDRTTLNALALATGATHMVEIEVVSSADPGGRRYETTLHDLYAFGSTQLLPVPAAVLKDSAFYEPVPQAIDGSVMLIPNALQMASLFAFPKFDQTNASYNFFRHDEERDFKGILGNWELNSVPRPRNFAQGEAKFVSSLALWSQVLQRRLNMYWRYSNINPSDKRYTLKSVLNIWYLGLTSENRFYLMYGKFGAPYVGLGFGMSFVTGSVADGNFDKVTPIGSGSVGYLVETSPQSFLELSGGFTMTPENHYESRFTALREFGFLKIKAGFWMPGLRNGLRGSL